MGQENGPREWATRRGIRLGLRRLRLCGTLAPGATGRCQPRRTAGLVHGVKRLEEVGEPSSGAKTEVNE